MEKGSIRNWIRKFDATALLKPEKLLLNLPFLLFCAFLAIVYIGNTHTAEKKVREINRLQPQLKELRWEYMTTKADLMYKSKQSEVAREVEPFGLREIQSPPFKIIVNSNEY